MKKHDLLSLISLFLTPVLLIVFGLILLIRPDSASGLIALVLGWAILLVGVGFAAALFATQSGPSFFGKLAAAIVCVGFGSWLVRHPLELAALIGRLAGVVLLVQGGRDLISGSGKTWSIVTAGAGLMLLCLPMTASRLVFSLCGLVMLVVGAVMLLDRLRRQRLEGGNDDPNIIDAL